MFKSLFEALTGKSYGYVEVSDKTPVQFATDFVVGLKPPNVKSLSEDRRPEFLGDPNEGGCYIIVFGERLSWTTHVFIYGQLKPIDLDFGSEQLLKENRDRTAIVCQGGFSPQFRQLARRHGVRLVDKHDALEFLRTLQRIVNSNEG